MSEPDQSTAVWRELGLNAAAVQDLCGRVAHAIDKGPLPSVQIALARHGRLALFETFGAAEATVLGSPGLPIVAIPHPLADNEADIAASIPLERIGEGQDVASAAVYLASSESSFVTGQVLNVNGGQWMA